MKDFEKLMAQFDTEVPTKKVSTRTKEVTVPHEVAKLVALKNYSPIKAWRKYKGVTQAELAKKLKLTQPAFSQIEKSEKGLQQDTVKKVARALGIKPEQLAID
ncbi:helix-turn-helix domain-containing protein [Piscirickettsia salmonis]|nr:helix-turn-helix transcriptional regulator [Piscirickettsia salmonis]